MDLDEGTIADLFKQAGYATGAFGKWHNGMQYPYHPLGRGFDYFYGFCSGHWGHYYDALMERNGKLVQGKGFCVDDFTTDAMSFIERSVNKEKPFFVYIPYNTPHSPMQVPDRWWNKFKDKKLEDMMRHRNPKKEDRLHLLAALAMCENIDWNVGRLLKKLDQLEATDDTIVVFFHDNGPNGNRWNGDMEGRKGSTEEGGTRSPLLIKWPKGIKAGTKVMQIASVRDLLPTLTELAGVKEKSKKAIDGKSLKTLLSGNTKGWKSRSLVSTWKGKLGVRDQRFRLGYKGKLFDMKNDAGQRVDVSKQFPKVTERLNQRKQSFQKKVLDKAGPDTRPFVIGHPGVSWTQIPARDGTAHGGIKRSNKFPNCSYFLNWTNKDDFVTWDVEVGESGRYEVELWYACSKKDLGSVIEVSLNGESVVTTITKPNNPPIVGMKEDRSPRSESYVKDFRPMKMGTISLTKGKSELKLQANTIRGSQAMEFRLLMLQRIEAK
jgi:hypothetical protein